MATLEKLQEDILDILQEPDIDEDMILDYLNKGLKYVASQILLDKLESSGTLTSEDSGVTSIPISWSFHRNLFDCQVEGSSDIKILNSIEQLKRIYPDYEIDATSGPVKYVLVYNNQILYYPIPDVGTTLTFKFFKLPNALVSPSDEPDSIIEGLQEDILHNYCFRRVWKKKEEGIEGPRINEAHYAKLLKTYMEQLEDTVTTGQSRPLPRRSKGWV